MRFTRKFKVGKYTCFWTLESVDPPKCVAEWKPRVPHKEEMTDDMWREYREGRDSFMGDVGEFLGIKVAVVEV